MKIRKGFILSGKVVSGCSLQGGLPLPVLPKIAAVPYHSFSLTPKGAKGFFRVDDLFRRVVGFKDSLSGGREEISFNLKTLYVSCDKEVHHVLYLPSLPDILFPAHTGV